MSAEISRLREDELPKFRQFCLENWGEPHPLIHNEQMFDYYYRRGDKINFIVARDENGDIISAGGYICASSSEQPDVFNSFLLSKRKSELAVSLRVLMAIKELSGARMWCCNNIRPKVAPVYQFLGCKTRWMNHYYRFNRDVKERKLSVFTGGDIPEPCIADGVEYIEAGSPEAISAFPFEQFAGQKPYKDAGYVRWRYFDNPWLDYRVLQFSESGQPFGLLMYRIIEWEGACVLRVVDYIGDRSRLALTGEALDATMKETGAEFCDMYAFGIDPGIMRQAGFVLRGEESGDIVPNYLEPPLMENTDFMIQTSDLDGFCMFRADGDQDRKRIIL